MADPCLTGMEDSPFGRVLEVIRPHTKGIAREVYTDWWGLMYR